MRITVILYVLKRLFDRNDLSLFLHLFCYYLFIDEQLNWYKLLYTSSYLFNPYFVFVDLCVSYSLDQRSFILKLVLGCDWKFSLGRIQTGHMDLLPSQACERLWWGCCFFVITNVAINKLIGFKAVPQFIKVWSSVGKCWLKIHQEAPRPIGLIPCICFVLHLKVIFSCWRIIVCFYSQIKGQKVSLG